VEELILRPMDVERRRLSVWRVRLEHRNPVLTLVVAYVNGDEGVQEPKLLRGSCYGSHCDESSR
jgi:hypothetical protein